MQKILKRVTIMAYDHRFPSSLTGITFRELMSAIFHAQDPRNRRVKWFAVNLSSTWSPLPPRDAHLAVSHSIFQFCTWERERETEREKGGGWNYVLSFIFERAQLWASCSSTCRLFSVLACQRCIGLLTPLAPNRERKQCERGVGGWKDFARDTRTGT